VPTCFALLCFALLCFALLVVCLFVHDVCELYLAYVAWRM
jgi:hypothetical protein